VVLVLIDALRPDRLGCYGYRRKIAGRTGSPSHNIDRPAASGTLFETCISQSNWTPVSMFSMLYGVNPHRPPGENDPLGHGFVDPWTKNLYPSKSFLYTLNRARGEGLTWDTRAIFTNPYLKTARFHAIFEDVSLPTPDFPPPRGYADAFQVNAEVAQEIAAFKNAAGRAGERRCLFLCAHHMDVHGPDPVPPCYYDVLATDSMDNERDPVIHRPPSRGGEWEEGDAAHLRRLSDNYDARLMHLDAAFGELLRLIRSELDMRKTLVIVAADHGESLGEKGFIGHGFGVYQPEIHVPLIPAGRGVPRGARVGGITRNLDIMAALAAFWGFNPRSDGENLLAPLSNRAAGAAAGANKKGRAVKRGPAASNPLRNQTATTSLSSGKVSFSLRCTPI